MSATYELFDGSEVKGAKAKAMRMLDERDPVANALPLNDAEIVEELHLLHPDMTWCPTAGGHSSCPTTTSPARSPPSATTANSR